MANEDEAGRHAAPGLLSLYTVYEEDRELFERLGLSAPEPFPHHSEVFIGSTPVEGGEVEVYCTMMPATFWRFEIRASNGARYVASTDSGKLVDYWPTVEKLATNMVGVLRTAFSTLEREAIGWAARKASREALEMDGGAPTEGRVEAEIRAGTLARLHEGAEAEEEQPPASARTLDRVLRANLCFCGGVPVGADLEEHFETCDYRRRIEAALESDRGSP